MFDEEPPQQQQQPRNNRRAPEPQFNWKGLVLLLASGLIILWAYFLNQSHAGGGEKNFAEFKQLVQDGRIVSSDKEHLYLVEEPGAGLQYIEGKFNDTAT